MSTERDTAVEIINHACRWEAEARLLGNLRAADISYSIQWLLGKSSEADRSVPVIDAAIAVIRAASIGDQNFVPCLSGSDAKELRQSLLKLEDTLKDM